MACPTNAEGALDAALLLYFVDKASPVLGRTKAQKTGFFVELALQREGLVATHFPFFRWHYGPFSRVLENALDSLGEKGLVETSPVSGFTVTPRGKIIIDLVVPELKDESANQETFLVIDDVLEWCRPRTGGDLIEAAYRVAITPIGMPGATLPIKEVPLGIDLIVPQPNHLSVDGELLAILEQQLAVTPAQIEAAALRSSDADRRLAEALREAEQLQPAE